MPGMLIYDLSRCIYGWRGMRGTDCRSIWRRDRGCHPRLNGWIYRERVFNHTARDEEKETVFMIECYHRGKPFRGLLEVEVK